MRLFEVDHEGVRGILAVLQGQANKPGTQQAVELPWETVKGYLKQFALGISTIDGFKALKNEEDPEGDVIKDIKDDGTVVLNTNVKNPEDAPVKTTRSPTVDQMASRSAKSAMK